MVKYVTFGNYDPKLTYMIIFIIIKIVYEYFLGDLFPDEIKIEFLRSDEFPREIIVFDVFQYLFIFSFGYILSKTEWANYSTSNRPSLTMKINNNNNTHKNLELIYSGTEEIVQFSVKFFTFVVILFVINNKLYDFFYLLFPNLGLDFWMVEAILLFWLATKMLKIKIYIHQKIAIGIVAIFSTIMKIISAIFLYYNKEEEDIEAWEIFLGIICFLVVFSTEAYIFSKIKYYFEYKYISEINMLMAFGFYGLIFSLIFSLAINFIECGDNDASKELCSVYEDENSTKYFDNYSVFFKNIWRKDRSGLINCLYFLLFLFKIVFWTGEYYFNFFIINVLNPIYLVCMYVIIEFIIKIIIIVFYSSNNSEEYYELIFDCLARFFAILGIIIYLELIELNFCGLNNYLKKNIELRGEIEVKEIIKIQENIEADTNEEINIELQEQNE